MMRLAVVLFPALLLTATPKLADAKFIEVWGKGIAGGAFGNGNASSDRDFYNWASGGAGGVEVGAKVLLFIGYIEYLRFFGGDTGANLISLNLGVGSSFTLSGGLKLVVRAVGSGYLGTLDAAKRDDTTASEEVQTRGIGARAGLGLRYEFGGVFGLGVTPQVGYHYFFGGAGESLLETEQNSSGYDLQVMGYLRIGLGF